MNDWTQPDLKQERPTLQGLIDSWSSLRWEPQPLRLPDLDRYLAEVARTHVNGGFVIGRWRAVEFSDAAAWFLARGHFDEYEYLRIFFNDPVVRAGLAEMQLPPDLRKPIKSLHAERSGVLGLDGDLAEVIVEGGAYEAFNGPACDAKDIASAAVDALTERRYEDFRLESSEVAWTPWFKNVAWDATFVLTDRARCETTVLCITDAD